MPASNVKTASPLAGLAAELNKDVNELDAVSFPARLQH